MPEPYYPAIGERVPVVGCYSEVMMHFKLAGQPIEIQLVQDRYIHNDSPAPRVVGQVWKDGRPFSSTITAGEAGFYYDNPSKCWYCYPAEGFIPSVPTTEKIA